MSNWISRLFPKHWSITHKDETVQEQRVERKINKTFKLDGRKTRWIPFYFNKLWRKIRPRHLFIRESKPVV